MNRKKIIRIRGVAIKALHELDQKIKEVRFIFPGILLRVPTAERVRDELAHAIDSLDSLYDPISPLELRPITSLAWKVMASLCRYEGKFLVSLFAVDLMWKRLKLLHPEVSRRYEIRDEIKKFDSIRIDDTKSILERQETFIKLNELMRVAERETKILSNGNGRKKMIFSQDFHEVVDHLCRQAKRKDRRLRWLTDLSGESVYQAIYPQN